MKRLTAAMLAAGILLTVAGDIAGAAWVVRLGGWLMAPALFGLSAILLLVLALAPAFPVSGALDKAPPQAHGLILTVGIALTLLWWGFLGAVLWSLFAFGPDRL